MGLMLHADVTGRPVVVVGAGRAGSEKIERLVAAGAVVTVVDPAAPPDSGHDVRRRPFEPGDVDGAWLVVVATGVPAVDDRVAALAEAAGALVTRADRPDGGGLAFVATLERGPVTIGVSTGGTSPALGRWLRDRIAVVVPESVGELAVLLRSRGRDGGRRRHAGLPLDRALTALEAGDRPLAEALLGPDQAAPDAD